MIPEQRKQILQFDGRKTSCIQQGKGRPAIVFLSGLGVSCDTWMPLLDQLAMYTEVFACDRPGYGKSAPVRHDKSGRDGQFVASHLNAALYAAGIAPPYIIVGHSMGGLYALCYANYFLSNLAGLVLLDARAPTFSTAAERHKAGSSRPPRMLTMLFPHHMKAEVRGAKAAEQQAVEPERLGEIPVTIIAASKISPGLSNALNDIWVREQRAFASRVTNGQFIIAKESGHDVHRDRPDLVIQEVISTLDRAAADKH